MEVKKYNHSIVSFLEPIKQKMSNFNKNIFSELPDLIGRVLIFVAFVFIILNTFVIVADPINHSRVDYFFNLEIPAPPEWTIYIPYLGYPIGMMSEYFSLHGLATIFVFVILLSIGGFLLDGFEKSATSIRKY